MKIATEDDAQKMYKNLDQIFVKLTKWMKMLRICANSIREEQKSFKDALEDEVWK